MMISRNYRRAAGIAAGILCSSYFCLSVWAEGPSSNVWLDVVSVETEARISVGVPLSYGFAVVGSVESGDDGPVTSENGRLLLSNVRVEVTDPKTGEYTIQVTGEREVPLKNYSTDVREEDLGSDNPERVGLPVSVRPYIREVPTTIINGITREHHWKPVKDEPQGVPEDFKKYRMGLNGEYFSEEGSIRDDSDSVTVYRLESELELEAPSNVEENGWTAGGLALIPSVTYVPVDVQVGGIQNQYKQVEQSVKVGAINWEITPGTLPDKTTP